MLKANEVKDAVKTMLAAAYPEEPVYTKRLPKDFDRPSKYVEVLEKTGSAANICTFAITARLRVVAFVPVDAYGDADDEAADGAGDELMELFLGSLIKAGDRRLDVDEVALEYGADYAAAVLTLSYMDDAPGAQRPGPERDLIRHVDINGKSFI